MGAKETIGTRIRAARGARPQTSVAQALGISQPALSSWESGKHAPDIVALPQLARVLGVSMDWLLTGDGVGPADQVAERPATYRAGIKVRTARPSAGTGADAGADHTEELLPLSDEQLRSIGRTSTKGLAAVRVRGDSMTPTLRHGDLVVVDTREREPREGVVVVSLNGALLVKRLQVLAAGRVRLISDNPAYGPVDVEPSEGADLHVHGRVLGVLGGWREL